jgi:hypothetical protein
MSRHAHTVQGYEHQHSSLSILSISLSTASRRSQAKRRKGISSGLLDILEQEQSMKKFSSVNSVNTLAGRYDLKLYIKQILMSFYVSLRPRCVYYYRDFC